MTHELGTPWSNAYFGRGQNATLSNTALRVALQEWPVQDEQPKPDSAVTLDDIDDYKRIHSSNGRMCATPAGA